jgi:type VI secretion system secreted protein Hcp
MKASKATPKLMLACATGEHFSMATLTIVRTDRESEDYFTITLTDVLVSAYRVGGSSASDPVPTDSISLNFSKIEFEYTPQSPDGSTEAPVKAGYDVKASKSV